MRNSIGYQILVNAILVVGLWTGFSIMSDMALSERPAGTLAGMHADARKAKTQMVRADLMAKRAEFKRCTNPDKPFLTDHVLIVGTDFGRGYDTGVVTEVTFDIALKGKGLMVLAYCE